jgi:hypothetical protein
MKSIRSHGAMCLLTGLALTALPLHASAQQVVPQKYADVGGWTIESYKADGQHMRCGAVPPGAPPSQSAFEISREGWVVVLAPATRDKNSDELKGAIDIDGRSTRGVFHRRDDGRIMTFLKAPQIKKLRSAKSITVTAGTAKTSIPLAGAGAALRKTFECDNKGGT